MDDKYYMEIALSLAQMTVGQTSPNPLVAALLVKNNQIIGQGVHLKAGSDHAEIVAIKNAIGDLAGATLYVTLEPCMHIGKTGPCVDAIIKSGIKRVVIATLDPNPLIAGNGVYLLKRANIAVTIGVCLEKAQEQNRIFFHYITTKTPYITLKAGMSIDAKLATKALESKWITGEAARLDAHNYRHSHDAILVGVNTIIHDDPSLTTRLKDGGKNPLRIILDTKLRTPISAKVVQDDDSKTLIVVGSEVDALKIQEYQQYPQVTILKMPTSDIDLVVLLKILGERQITSILVEGGTQVLSAFFDQHIYNEVVLYVAPKLLGGITSPSLYMGSGIESLSKSAKLKFKTVNLIDQDLKIVLIREAR